MSCFFILIKIEPNIKNILYYLFLAVFPIFICFNSVVPLRFLVPYYSIFGCLNILQYVKRNESVKLVLLFCSVLLFYIFFDEIQIKNKYLKMDSKYNETIYKLIYYSAKSENNKPIIINLLDSDKFIPVKPLAKLPRMNSMFLNIFLFNANDFYINGWNEICKCNALSLKEKIDFIVVNQNLFLIDDKSFLFLKKYFKVKYNTELNKIDLENFDEELKLCKLNY